MEVSPVVYDLPVTSREDVQPNFNSKANLIKEKELIAGMTTNQRGRRACCLVF